MTYEEPRFTEEEWAAKQKNRPPFDPGFTYAGEILTGAVKARQNIMEEEAKTKEDKI